MASTVGFPRESRISLALTSVMDVMSLSSGGMVNRLVSFLPAAF